MSESEAGASQKGLDFAALPPTPRSFVIFDFLESNFAICRSTYTEFFNKNTYLPPYVGYKNLASKLLIA